MLALVDERLGTCGFLEFQYRGRVAKQRTQLIDVYWSTACDFQKASSRHVDRDVLDQRSGVLAELVRAVQRRDVLNGRHVRCRYPPLDRRVAGPVVQDVPKARCKPGVRHGSNPACVVHAKRRPEPIARHHAPQTPRRVVQPQLQRVPRLLSIPAANVVAIPKRQSRIRHREVRLLG